MIFYRNITYNFVGDVIMFKIFKGIISVFLVLSVIFLPGEMVKFLENDKISEEMYSRREKYFYGVINLWQIDCFEGGTGSRANWLKNIVSAFEKRNNGVFVNVESISLETANNLINSEQKKPDIISFSTGLLIDENMLMDLSGIKVSGYAEKVNNIAVPWCMGAYFMIGDINKENWGTDGKIIKAKKAEKTVYSVGVPERNGYVSLKGISLNCNNSFSDEKALFFGTSQEIFEAYNYSKKVNRMIGTQRDFYRMASAQSKNNLRESQTLYLGYTDLVQYLAIFKCENSKKVTTMKQFISFMLEAEQQSKLDQIGMFPVIKEANPNYEISYMVSAWENIKKQGIKCESYLFNSGAGDEEQKKYLDFLQKKE